MKAIKKNPIKSILRSRLVQISLLVIGLACIIMLFLSPFSPIYAVPVPSAWSGNFVAYAIGDVVTYNGSTYKCIQSHTSKPNSDPADTADLWTLQPNTGVPTSVVPTRAPTLKPTPTSVVPTPAPTPTSTPTGGLTPVTVTFYSDQGLMADGNETHLGACAAWVDQFPFGTKLKLYNPSNLTTAAYSCTVEDTGTHICKNDVDVSLPGQAQLALQLGVKAMQLQVVGFDQVVAQQAAANHPGSDGCSLGVAH